jgi:hypothetical protein
MQEQETFATTKWVPSIVDEAAMDKAAHSIAVFHFLNHTNDRRSWLATAIAVPGDLLQIRYYNKKTENTEVIFLFCYEYAYMIRIMFLFCYEYACMIRIMLVF